MNTTAQKTEAEIVAWAKSNGSNARDARDATHEGWHATSLGVKDWDREKIHAAVMKLRPADRASQEVQARAAEWLVCEALGVDYNLDSWAMIAAMEAMRAGFSMPFKAWTDGIQYAKKNKDVIAYVAMVLEAGQEAQTSGE